MFRTEAQTELFAGYSDELDDALELDLDETDPDNDEDDFEEEDDDEFED